MWYHASLPTAFGAIQMRLISHYHLLFVPSIMSPKDQPPVHSPGASALPAVEPPDRSISMSPISPSPFASLVEAEAAVDSVAAEPASNGESSSPFKLSLWLLPPDDIRDKLQTNIGDIAELTGGPTFVPHVTILGGIPVMCSSEGEANRWANELLQELRVSLPSVDGIPCCFGRDEGRRPYCVFEDGTIAAADERCTVQTNSEVKWNQSCVTIMDRCSQFGKAVELTYNAVCRVDERFTGGKALADTADDPSAFDWTTTLKPPLCEPHYSHAYGNNGPDLIAARKPRGRDDCDDLLPFLVNVPPNFVSVEALLIWTWPASLDGVSSTWKEVGRVKMQ